MSRATKKPAPLSPLAPPLAPAIARHVREGFIAARRGVSAEWHHGDDATKDPAAFWRVDLDTNPDGHATVKIRRSYLTAGRYDLAFEVTQHMSLAEVHELAHMLQVAAERLGTMTPADDWQDYPPKG